MILMTNIYLPLKTYNCLNHTYFALPGVNVLTLALLCGAQGWSAVYDCGIS